jgi:hypothetical protein
MISDQPDVDFNGTGGRVDNAGWGEGDVHEETNEVQAVDMDEHREIEEYGASRDEWKFLWSSKKP